MRAATAPDSNATLRFHTREKMKMAQNGKRTIKGERKTIGHALPAETHVHSFLSPPSFWSGRIAQVAPLLASSQMVTWQLESKRGELPEYFIAFISHPNI